VTSWKLKDEAYDNIRKQAIDKNLITGNLQPEDKDHESID